MKMSNTAFLTFVYPGMQQFFNDFIGSVAGQTERSFDLVVISDGLKPVKIKDVGRRVIVRYKSASIPKVREFGIRFVMAQGYDFVVFGDSDDTFKSNRVSVSLSALKRWDIVVNDLSIADCRGKVTRPRYLSNRFKNREKITLKRIVKGNLLGLSNTACRVSALKNIALPGRLIAVDWYLFSRMLARGCRAVFRNDTTTLYRQYGGNTVGLGKWTADRYRRALKAKLIHYREMAKSEKKYSKKYHALEKCVRKINRMTGMTMPGRDRELGNPVWWEDVGTAEEPFNEN